MPSPLQVVADIRAIRGNQQPLALLERSIVAIADSQRGLVTLHQLLGLGLSHDAVERRVRIGRLTRIHQGVYAVGTARLDAHARWKAATLACGDGSLLCWLPAAGLWSIRPEPAGQAHVLIPGNGRLGHAGIAMHRMRSVPSGRCRRGRRHPRHISRADLSPSRRTSHPKVLRASHDQGCEAARVLSRAGDSSGGPK